jgi:hypothetical protein
MPVFVDQRPGALVKVKLEETVQYDARKQPKKRSAQGVESRHSLARNYGF